VRVRAVRAKSHVGSQAGLSGSAISRLFLLVLFFVFALAGFFRRQRLNFLFFRLSPLPSSPLAAAGARTPASFVSAQCWSEDVTKVRARGDKTFFCLRLPFVALEIQRLNGTKGKRMRATRVSPTQGQGQWLLCARRRDCLKVRQEGIFKWGPSRRRAGTQSNLRASRCNTRTFACGFQNPE